MKQGWVYVLTNQGMPGLIKIGFTKNLPQQRARELYGTGVAYPFEVVYQVQCHQYQAVEKAVHAHLDDKRVNGGREFFACTVEEAARVIRTCAGAHFISAQDLRTGVFEEAAAQPAMVEPSRPHALNIRHLLLGGLVFSGVIGLGFWGMSRYSAHSELTETQQLLGYSPALIGAADINMRTCSSTECGVVSVLPAGQPILVKPQSRTAKNWLYAEFHGEVCYPQHYERGQGCRAWTSNHIVEGWVYADNLADDSGGTKAGGSVLDALF